MLNKMNTLKLWRCIRALMPALAISQPAMKRPSTFDQLFRHNKRLRHENENLCREVETLRDYLKHSERIIVDYEDIITKRQVSRRAPPPSSADCASSDDDDDYPVDPPFIDTFGMESGAEADISANDSDDDDDGYTSSSSGTIDVRGERRSSSSRRTLARLMLGDSDSNFNDDTPSPE